MREESQEPYNFLGSSRSDGEVLVIKRVENDELIAEIVRNAAGVEIVTTETGDLVMKETEHQIMNIKGAKKLYFNLRMVLNPITTLTKWTEVQINQHVTNTVHSFIKWVYVNWKTYGIKKEDRDQLIDKYRVAVHAKFCQSLNGFMNDSINTQKVKQYQDYTMNQKNRSIWRRKQEEDIDQ